MTGAELFAVRLQLQLTQAQLGAALGVTRNTVANYERAETVPASVGLAMQALTARTIGE